MKLLLDQGLPRSATRLLGDAGIDTVHTGECGLSRASDASIIEYARDQGRTVITLDSDFQALMALANAASPSVIRIRIEGLGAKAAADLILLVLERCREDLDKGALVSVMEDKIRVRNLPLGALA